VLSWIATRAGHAPRFIPNAAVAHIHGGGWRRLIAERATRGREFVQVRAEFEGWSRQRLVLYALACPALPLLVLARAGAASLRPGWLASFFLTLPVQAAAHWAWSIGEAAGACQLIWSRRAP
jgi:hypothetical protein